MTEDRYDVRVQGTHNPDLDSVCPTCHSAVGYPCTVKVLDGAKMVDWIHDERKDANEQTHMAEGKLD